MDQTSFMRSSCLLLEKTDIIATDVLVAASSTVNSTLRQSGYS